MTNSQNGQPRTCTKKYFRIDRREIHFLRFILEGYDGLAVVRTVDPRQGLVVLHVSPGGEREVAEIVADVQREIKIEPVSLAEQEEP